MLIVHEDSFHGEYLAGVLRDLGAVVADLVPNAAAGLDLLDRHAREAIVLATSVEDQEAGRLTRAALDRGIAVGAVRPARTDLGAIEPGVSVVSSPCAGFQVADALVGLLAGRRSRVGAPGPMLRGH